MAHEVIRTRLSPSAGTRRNRTFDERVFVRFPSVLPWLTSAVMRLPPRSRARRAYLSRLVRGAWAASDRGDIDLCLCGVDPNVEVVLPGSGTWSFPDLSGTHLGHEGWLRVWRAIHELLDVAIRPEEIIDAGNRLLVTGETTVRGAGSGIRVSDSLNALYTVHAGRIVREQYFNEREEALKTAGIRPEDLPS